MIQQILSQAASIFLLIGLGLLAARTKIFPEDGTDVLCRLQLNVVTPVMILVTMQGHTFAGQLAMDTLWSFLSYGLTVATVGLLSFPLVRLLRLGEEDQGVCRIQLAFKNIGFMGIPLVSAVLGQRPGVVIVLMNTLFGVLLYSLGMVLLLYRRGCRVFSRDFLRRVVNLPLVSSLLGILVLVTGFTLPETVNRGLTLVSDMMVPLGMFIVGLQLSVSLKLLTVCNSSSLKGQLLGIPGSRRFWITFPSFNARFASFFAFRFLIKNYTSLVRRNPHQFSRSVLLANCLSLALCLLWDHTAIEWMVEELWLQKRMDEMGPFWCIPFWERHSQVLRLCFGFACAHSVEACPYSIAKKEEHTHQSQRALTHHSIHLHRQGTSHSLEMECSINAHSCFTRALIPLLLEWTESAMRIQTRYLRKWIR